MRNRALVVFSLSCVFVVFSFGSSGALAQARKGASGEGSVAREKSGPARADLPGVQEFKQCQKLPAGKKVLKLNLKPDSEVADLIGWMSTVSCTPFVFAGEALRGKKVTVMSPQLLTPEEAYQLFIGALASVDLTIEPLSSAGRDGKVLRIVKTPSR